MSLVDRRGRLAGGVALAVAAVAPLTAYVGNLGLAPLLAGAGLASTVALARPGRPSVAFALLAAAALLAAGSCAWSVAAPSAFPHYRQVEAFTGLKLVLQLALYGAFVRAAGDVSPTAGRRAALVLATAFTLVTALLLVEAVGGAALYRWIKSAAHQATRPDLARRNVARAAYAAALVLWPAVLALRDRGWAAAAAFLGTGSLAAAVALRVDAPVVAIAASSGVFLLVRYGGAWAAEGLGALAAALVAGAPLLTALLGRMFDPGALTGGVAKASWGARVAIWRFTAERIVERPLGLGLDGSRAFPGVIPLHPHDFALQVWLELGAAGATLAAAFWWLVLHGCAELRRRDPALGAAAAASACAYLVIGALSFGAWQEWWLALGALTAALVAWSARARATSPIRGSGLYRVAS